MLDRVLSRKDKLWAYTIGLGLALTPIHSRWLTELVTTDGTVGFFIPSFGITIWLMASLFFLQDHWSEIDWGKGKILVPMFIIVAFMGVSGFLNGNTIGAKLAPLFMGLSLLSVYGAARYLGKEIFKALVPFVVITATAIVIMGLLNPGHTTGGIITNYCAAAGFLVFGGVVNQGKWQWLLVAVVLVGLFFTGAQEALFIVVVVGITVLVRKDVSRRLVLVAGSLVVLAGLWFLAGFLIPLYTGYNNFTALFDLLLGRAVPDPATLAVLTTGRWEGYLKAYNNMSILGYGYSLSVVGGGIIHNIPLIIAHQIGPIAAIAWAFVTVYCLVRTKWKYAWIAVIAMCVFDHYLWTQFMPYWWCLVGVSTASEIKSDLIFRRNNDE